jgi:hypothetical protein
MPRFAVEGKSNTVPLYNIVSPLWFYPKDASRTCNCQYGEECHPWRREFKILENKLSISVNVKGKGNGKAVPLQAWSGPDGSRKLSFADFMTTAQDGGKVASLTHRPPLLPGNTPGTHFC